MSTRTGPRSKPRQGSGGRRVEVWGRDGSRERGALPADRYSAPAPSRPGSGSGKSQCPQRPPADSHRPREPQAELCPLTLEIRTTVERVGVGSLPMESLTVPRGLLPVPFDRAGPGWEMESTPPRLKTKRSSLGPGESPHPYSCLREVKARSPPGFP